MIRRLPNGFEVLSPLTSIREMVIKFQLWLTVSKAWYRPSPPSVAGVVSVPTPQNERVAVPW